MYLTAEPGVPFPIALLKASLCSLWQIVPAEEEHIKLLLGPVHIEEPKMDHYKSEWT